MADELEQIIKEPSESQQRITQLSNKVKDESDARAVAEAKASEAEEKALQAERKAAFAEGFIDVMSTNPQAKDHKADIEAKVLSGYTVQDATFAVLGAAGKLNTMPRDETFAAGGSASTALPDSGGQKSINEMNREEMRAELASRGDLIDILQPRSQQ